MSHRRPDAGLLACVLLLSACASLFVAGCASRQMEPARKAIADIENAVTSAGTEPAKYAPDALKDVDDQLAALKTRFEKKDYAGVLDSAPATLMAARNLPAVAARRKAELHAQLRDDWATLSSVVPKEIEDVRVRVDDLAARKKVPAGVTQAMLASARQGIDDARALWERAVNEDAARHPEQAVTLANQARERASGVATMLGTAGAPRLK